MLTRVGPDSGRIDDFAASLAASKNTSQIMQEEEKSPPQTLSR